MTIKRKMNEGGAVVFEPSFLIAFPPCLVRSVGFRFLDETLNDFDLITTSFRFVTLKFYLLIFCNHFSYFY